MGLSRGDCCVVMMPNSIEYITVYYALAKMGVASIPVNFLYRTFELEYILKDSRPKAFIGAISFLDEIRKVWKKTAPPPIRLAMGYDRGRDFMDLKRVFSDQETFASYQAQDDDTLNILYTSGTTGVPKGVMLTHKNLARTAKILAEMRGESDPRTVVIGVLPLFHVYGITSVLNVSIYLGLTIHLFKHFDPDAVIKVVEDEEVTVLFAVPTMYNRLIQTAVKNPPKRTSLRFCVSGGASLPLEFLRQFETLFKAKIYEGYGLTEAPVCIENPYGKLTKAGSIGKAIPEFSASIVDDAGNNVPDGEVGELVIRGPGVMKGYLNRPRETEETIKYGWLHTGDMAQMDGDAYFYIVDRKKDLVIRGGYNVYPREIEEVLYQIPQILEAAVFGIPQEDLGEEVAAVVVLKEDAQIDAEAIRAYVKERVAPYKYPRLIKIVEDMLPKSGSGKILKKEIRKQYTESF
jgi:long-chain acyl-CoA synthetase